MKFEVHIVVGDVRCHPARKKSTGSSQRWLLGKCKKNYFFYYSVVISSPPQIKPQKQFLHFVARKYVALCILRDKLEKLRFPKVIKLHVMYDMRNKNSSTYSNGACAIYTPLRVCRPTQQTVLDY